MPDPGGSGPLTEPGGPLRRLLLALVGLLVLLVYGTVGYMVIERYSFLDALFMTVITVSTVGFQEVHHLDAAGQAFTISVIVLGVIGFLYAFGMLVELLSSGDLQRHRRVRQVQRRLDALRDHVIVCGYGRTGRQAGIELTQSQQQFVVIEWNPDGLANVEQDRVLLVQGDASDDEVLERAGIGRARALISAVDSDERNVYIVLTARSLRPDLYIVARSSHPDSAEKLRRAGADRVVSPYTLSGRRMAALAMQPAVVDTFDLLVGGADSSMRVEELVVGADGGRARTAADLRRSGAVLLALRSGDGALRVGPGDEDVLRQDDIVVAMGTRDQLTALAAALAPAPAGH
jgi:voltage-gated potassium channel